MCSRVAPARGAAAWRPASCLHRARAAPSWPRPMPPPAPRRRSRSLVSLAAVLATWPALCSAALWGLVSRARLLPSPSRRLCRAPRASPLLPSLQPAAPRGPCLPRAAHVHPGARALAASPLGGWRGLLQAPSTSHPVFMLVSSVPDSVSRSWSWGPGAGGASGGPRSVLCGKVLQRRLCLGHLLFCAVRSMLSARKCGF